MDTETGDSAVTKFGVPKEMLKSAETCAKNYLKVVSLCCFYDSGMYSRHRQVDTATKESTSGKFVDIHTGDILDW